MAERDHDTSGRDNGATPWLHEQVAEFVRGRIVDGALRPGDRVPSLRALVRCQGVSMATATRAYEALEQEGWIEARPQSGFYVRPRPAAALEPLTGVTPPGEAAGMDRASMDRALMSGEACAEDVVALALALPAADLLPARALNRSLQRSMRRYGEALTHYAFAPGVADLRRQIAARAAAIGYRVHPDDIVVTTGCSEALTIALRCVARPGDVIAVESPTFFKILSRIESLGMRALELPTDPVTGVDPEALELAFARDHARAAVLMPNFNNPLGSLMSRDTRERVIASAVRHRKAIIEDDIYGDLHLAGQRPPPLRAQDDSGRILTASSFSKTIAPGYRVGWLMPGRFLADAISLQQDLSFAGAMPMQLAMADFLESGGHARHLRRVRPVYRRNVERMRHAIGAAFPSGTRVSQPAGGFVLWVQLPAGVDGTRVYHAAFAEGIRVTPGTLFSPGATCDGYIRLSAGEPWNDRLDRAIRRLGEIVADQRAAAA